MPINDPRVQDATEDEVLIDLLIRHMQDRTTSAESDPSEAARQFAEENPEGARIVIAAHEDWLKTDRVQAGIRKLLGRDAPPEPPRLSLSKAAPTRQRVRP